MIPAAIAVIALLIINGVLWITLFNREASNAKRIEELTEKHNLHVTNKNVHFLSRDPR